MKALLVPLILISLKVYAEGEAPTVNTVKGCPCLDCPYFVKGQRSGLWKAKKETPLLSTPESDSKKIGTLSTGETSVALGGEIQITPGELEVVFQHNKFAKGDAVYITQEDADTGTWKVWHNGKEYFEDLSSMVGEKEPCKKPSETCWAKVIRPLKSEWWVNLRTKASQSGWTKLVDDFSFDRSSCM